jgi:hypothetical protein
MKLLIIFSILCCLALSSLSTSSLRKRRRTRGEYTLIIQKFAPIALAQWLRKDIIDKYFVNDYNGSLTLSIQEDAKVLTSITIQKHGEHAEPIDADSYIGYEILKFHPLIISLKVNYFQYIFQIQNSQYFHETVKPELEKLMHVGKEKLLNDLINFYKPEYEKLINSENPLIKNIKELQESLDWTNKVIEHLTQLSNIIT